MPSDISDLPLPKKYKGVHLHERIKVRPMHLQRYLHHKCDLYPTPEGGYFNLKKEGVHLMEFHVSVATQWQWGFQAPPTRANWFNRNGAGVGFHGTLFARAALRCAEQHSTQSHAWTVVNPSFLKDRNSIFYEEKIDVQLQLVLFNHITPEFLVFYLFRRGLFKDRQNRFDY
jgi:hypothetical protein